MGAKSINVEATPTRAQDGTRVTSAQTAANGSEVKRYCKPANTDTLPNLSAEPHPQYPVGALQLPQASDPALSCGFLPVSPQPQCG